MIRYIYIFILTLTAIFALEAGYAKKIDLYEQPNNNGKVMGTVDSEVGIIPIFSPKGSDWIKVADPRNGNTGWVKTNSFTSSTPGTSSFTFSQKVINDSSGPHTYQMLQFGAPKNLSPGDAKALSEQMNLHQQQLQNDVQKMAQDIYKNAQLMMPDFPIVVPVVMVPVVAAPPQKKSAP